MDITRSDLEKILESFQISDNILRHTVLVDIDIFQHTERVIKHYVRLYGTEGNYVVKILRLSMCPAPMLEAQARFSEFYREKGIPTPHRYSLSCGTFTLDWMASGIDVKVMVEDDAGDMLSEFNEETIIQIGRLLGKMHRLSEVHDLHFRPGNFYEEFKAGKTAYLPLWERTGTDFLPYDLLEQILPMYDLRLKEMRESWEKLPRYTVQGDMYRMNLSMKDGELCLIDFDRMGDEVLLADMLLTWFRFRYDPLIWKNFKAAEDEFLWRLFLKAYEAERPLIPEEQKALPDEYAVLGAVYATRLLADAAAEGRYDYAAENFKEVMEILKGKKWIEKNIWICGLDIISFGVMDKLKARGKSIAGIIDKNFDKPTRLFGTTIYPISWLKEGGLENPWFVITAFKKKHRIEYERFIDMIYGENLYVDASNTREIRIDVSGVCNLRCPSCQVGNYSRSDFDYSGRGFMDETLFGQILDKIQKEVPDNPAIYLFTLGEPFLNRKLPKLIEKVHDHGWMAVLSSNLSVDTDMEEVMKSAPDVLKISVSGFYQKIYGTTHVGGNIERVKANMKEIRRLIDKYGLATRVMVGYHVYSNNQGDELFHMKEFSQKLGFLFQPTPALYFNMFKRTGLTPFLPEEKCFIKDYYDDGETILKIPEKQWVKDERVCRNFKDKLFIDYDGRVMLCELFHRDGIYKNYLDVSMEDIQEWRQNHWICQRCRSYGMDLR